MMHIFLMRLPIYEKKKEEIRKVIRYLLVFLTELWKLYLHPEPVIDFINELVQCQIQSFS